MSDKVILKEKDKIDEEWHYPPNATRFKVYIFECKTCKVEKLRVRKLYIKKHSGECKRCSAKRTIVKNGGMRRKRPYEARYNNFLRRTQYDEIKNDITYECFLEFTKIKNCHYCERTIPWEPYSSNSTGYFLDRKDNNKWHTIDNVVVCCGVCNNTKRNYFTYEEFKQLSPILKQIREKREE